MRLTLDLIPFSSFYSNVRTTISKNQWDLIRNQVYSKALYLCEICGDNSALDAHEVWEYKNSIQKLIKLQALCRACHGVKHFGLSEIRGKRQQALLHLIKINNISESEAEDYIRKEFLIWKERSKKKWKLDLSYLEEFGIKI